MRSILYRRSRSSQMLCGMRGYSMLELAVAMAVVGVLAKIALPEWNAQRVQIVTAQRQLVSALRLARGSAITKSIHYQIAFPDSTHITTSAMMESPAGSGTWIVDTTKVSTQLLPKYTSLKSTAVTKLIEFNSRGLAITNTLPTPSGGPAPQVDLQDTFGAVKSAQVWPSGQINVL